MTAMPVQRYECSDSLSYGAFTPTIPRPTMMAWDVIRREADTVGGYYETARTIEGPRAVAEARQRLQALAPVERVSERTEDGITVLCVTGSFLSMEDYDTILDTAWQVLDKYPSEFFDVTIHDRFGE